MSTRFVTLRAISSTVCACCVLSQARQPQQRHGGRNRRQRLPPFVRRHARELAQALGLFGNGLRVQADEGFDRLLQQHADRVMQPRDHARRTPTAAASASTGSIRLRRTASGCRRAAGTRAAPGGATRAVVPQLAELARLFDDGGVGGDRLLLGRLQVGADVDDQRRNVIEQAVAREHFVGFNRQQVAAGARTIAPPAARAQRQCDRRSPLKIRS